MTKKLNWRLGKLPTPDEVRELIKDKIITQEEGREILFKEEEETARDIKSLESEIKFLRELVEKLAKGSTSTIVETIRYVEKPYIRYDWYHPYQVWCGSNQQLYSAANALNTLSNVATNAIGSLGSGGSSNASVSAFSAINTF